MSAALHRVFSIGHSTHSIDQFVALLKQHGVTAVADVRSKPYSRFNPQFNREDVQQSLEARGIKYVFLGRELGARPEDPSCYCNGRVQFATLANTDLFRDGIERVLRGASNYCVALMCAEKEPLNCHRTLLVAHALVGMGGAAVEHILANGDLEPHGRTMERLLDRAGISHQDLFRTKEEMIANALLQQQERIAYANEELATADSPGENT